MADARGVPELRRESLERSGAYPELNAMLWTVREILELVLFKLDEVGLILGSGSPRWLARADDELRAALDELQAIELMRAAEFNALLRAMRRSSRTTLSQLIGTAPEPWPAILGEHRAALLSLSQQVEDSAYDSEQTLTALVGDRRTSSPPALGLPRVAVPIDITGLAAYQSALASMCAIPQLSLEDFLA